MRRLALVFILSGVAVAQNLTPTSAPAGKEAFAGLARRSQPRGQFRAGSAAISQRKNNRDRRRHPQR